MLEHALLGKLTLQAIPYHIPLIRNTDICIIILAILALAGITYFKKWTYLWKEWLISVDHKKIGIMYIILAMFMLLRGFADAVLMRSQQMLSVGHHMGYLSPEHFAQIFTAHGVIMIFFMAMPFMFGLVNLTLPLQIGCRDVAFPYLNSLSFWLTVSGALLVNMSLLIGSFAKTGWLAYPPLSELHFSPGVGVDYYIWAVQIAGIGSLLSGINFFVTIIKMRCPGMSLMKMPIFVWSILCTMILVMLAFPILTATLAMLFFDRFFGMHFFTMDNGGNFMMYINLIWAWGHPEVYILILPAFGIFSEVVATFSKKRLFGYTTMVWATASITVLSFVVWLHHFFTMGSGANVNAFFGIMTMIIAIPTGVKVFNWLFTMYKGRVSYHTPMLWTVAFLLTFIVGGMTGVLMSLPPVDFQLHNSVFLVAHFHNVIIGGVIYGYMAGLFYWFPKAFGFKLNEKIGRFSIYCWFIGFFIAFMPLYILGLKGMTRRMYHYSALSGWHPYLVVAAVGALIIGIGIFSSMYMFAMSYKNRKKLNDVTGDPWDGRTLEWSVSSPAPFYNFAHIPDVTEIDDYWGQKQRIKNGESPVERPYEDIHMPKDTPIGFVIGMISFVFGFAMIWHIHWLSILSLAAIPVSLIIRTYNTDTTYYVKASEVEEIETAFKKAKEEVTA